MTIYSNMIAIIYRISNRVRVKKCSFKFDFMLTLNKSLIISKHSIVSLSVKEKEFPVCLVSCRVLILMGEGGKDWDQIVSEMTG